MPCRAVQLRGRRADLEGLRGDGHQPGVDRRPPRRRAQPDRDLHERVRGLSVSGTPASSASAASRPAWRPAARSPNGSRRVAGERAVGQVVGGARGEDLARGAAQCALRAAHAQDEPDPRRERGRAAAIAGRGRSASRRGSRAGRSCAPARARRRSGAATARRRPVARAAWRSARRCAQRPREALADQRDALHARRRRCRTRPRRRRSVSRAVVATARPESCSPRPMPASSAMPSWTLKPSHANRHSTSTTETSPARVAARPGRRRWIEAHACPHTRKEREGLSALPRCRTPTVLQAAKSRSLQIRYPAMRRLEPGPGRAGGGPRRSARRWSRRP